MNFQAQLDMHVCAFVAVWKHPWWVPTQLKSRFFSPTYLCIIHFRHRIGFFFSLQPWIKHARSYDINATNTTLGLEVLTLFTEPSPSFFHVSKARSQMCQVLTKISFWSWFPLGCCGGWKTSDRTATTFLWSRWKEGLFFLQSLGDWTEQAGLKLTK